jgi:signal transduction histidine kinase
MKVVPGSLRGKVTLGYIVGLVLMVGLVVVNWRNLAHLQKIVSSAEQLTRISTAVLEARRYEKNFFLYRQSRDYSDLLAFSGEAQNLVADNRDTLVLFAEEEILDGLEDNLQGYLALLQSVVIQPSEEHEAWESRVRAKGQEIAEAAEKLSRTEHRVMERTLHSSRLILLGSVGFVFAFGLGLSIFFFRLLIRPLKLIEQHMDRITGGDLSLIPFRSQDRELVSLNRAFHRMLYEIETSQQHIIQSEKLASFGTLLFGVAHEINNPLSNILTSAQILGEELEEADPGYKRELLSQIEDETDRAKDIVRSILDYSRKGEKERVELLALVYEAVRFVRGDLPAKIDIEVRIPAGLFVFADRQGLQQAFLNLLKNSIESMPAEGKITIRARVTSKGMIEVVFKDTGAGIPHEAQSKIFDPFFTTKEGQKGSGLGLFIVHNMVTEHAGTIGVQSDPGHGTAFVILLPAKEKEDGAQSQTADS